jgi:hypothetical protein
MEGMTVKTTLGIAVTAAVLAFPKETEPEKNNNGARKRIRTDRLKPDDRRVQVCYTRREFPSQHPFVEKYFHPAIGPLTLG